MSTQDRRFRLGPAAAISFGTAAVAQVIALLIGMALGVYLVGGWVYAIVLVPTFLLYGAAAGLFAAGITCILRMLVWGWSTRKTQIAATVHGVLIAILVGGQSLYLAAGTRSSLPILIAVIVGTGAGYLSTVAALSTKSPSPRPV